MLVCLSEFNSGFVFHLKLAVFRPIGASLKRVGGFLPAQGKPSNYLKEGE